MCDKCPKCGSYKASVLQYDFETVDERVYVRYDATCLDCGTTFEIVEVFTLSEVAQYYKGEETARETIQ